MNEQKNAMLYLCHGQNSQYNNTCSIRLIIITL